MIYSDQNKKNLVRVFHFQNIRLWLNSSYTGRAEQECPMKQIYLIPIDPKFLRNWLWNWHDYNILNCAFQLLLMWNTRFWNMFLGFIGAQTGISTCRCDCKRLSSHHYNWGTPVQSLPSHRHRCQTAGSETTSCPYVQRWGETDWKWISWSVHILAF